MTFYTRKAALEAQNALHNIKTLTGVSVPPLIVFSSHASASWGLCGGGVDMQRQPLTSINTPRWPFFPHCVVLKMNLFFFSWFLSNFFRS